MLLKCPGFHELSGLVQLVVKEALISFLLDEADPRAELDDTYYYSEVYGSIYNDDGEVRPGLEMYNNAEWLGFVADLSNNVEQVKEDTRKAIELVLSLNADEIEAAYREIGFVTLHCDTALNNHILFKVHGVTI